MTYRPIRLHKIVIYAIWPTDAVPTPYPLIGRLPITPPIARALATVKRSASNFPRQLPIGVSAKVEILGTLQGGTEHIEEAGSERPPYSRLPAAVRPGLEAHNYGA